MGFKSAKKYRTVKGKEQDDKAINNSGQLKKSEWTHNLTKPE